MWFLGGRHTNGCWRKGVYVRWHPGAIRKPARLSRSDTQNPLPWSGCVNLLHVKSREHNCVMWEPGKSQKRNILSEGLCHGQLLPTSPGEVWTLWAVWGSLVWEMHWCKVERCLVLVRRGKIQRRLWEEITPVYSASDKTESPAWLFTP